MWFKKKRLKDIRSKYKKINMVFGKEEKKKAKALLVLHNSFLKAEDP